MHEVIYSLEELRERLEWLLEKRERLEKELSRKGYSLKRINGHTYLYKWKYEDGKARWRSLGNVKKVGVPNGKVGEIMEEIEKIDKALMEIAKLLEVAKLEAFSVLSDD
jgi:PP-loop superfamily ATP-utilizing enzyme